MTVSCRKKEHKKTYEMYLLRAVKANETVNAREKSLCCKGKASLLITNPFVMQFFAHADRHLGCLSMLKQQQACTFRIYVSKNNRL